MQSKITFYGGAGTVTGSNFLLDTRNGQAGGAKFLIDCGLTQGSSDEQKQNSEPFAYNPREISHLIITHAHLDHVGRIPMLVKNGFTGAILSTEPTRAIAEPLLRDELAIMQHNQKRSGVEPLYTEADIARALTLWQTHPYREKISLPDSIELEFLNSGHILGSAMALFRRTTGGQAKSIVFTGDLGGGNSPLLPETEEPLGVNYLVMESVYGDRTRTDAPRREELENAIENAAARGGTLLIPAFSTERTQDLLFEIRALMLEKRVPQCPVYIDSPLAEKITEAYLQYPQYFTEALEKRIRGGENIFTFPDMHFVASTEESHALVHKPGFKIILAGSGMGQGGRVIGHEEVLLPDAKNTVLMVGYQAAGTTGRKLLEGASSVEIWRKKVPVHAHIEVIYGYSAHMDGEQLVEFVNKVQGSLAEVFVVMGEPAASSTLVQRIRDYLGVKAIAPEVGESATIEL